MAVRHARRKLNLAVCGVILLALSGASIARADWVSPYNYGPNRGDLYADRRSFGSWGIRAYITGWVIWETYPQCDADSRLYAFCEGWHHIFEHNVELSNEQYRYYPEEYRWARHPIAGYATNYPGTTYADTPASDDPGLENLTVGTLDANFLNTYQWYYADIFATPDHPGPNWTQIRIDIGSADQGACWADPAWCMLRAHAEYSIIPLTHHRTLPGYIAYP